MNRLLKSRGAAAAAIALAMFCGQARAGSGVSGATLCLNADPSQDAYRHIEDVLGRGAVESPSDGVYTPARPHVLQLPGEGAIGPYFAILSIEPSDVNLDRKTMAEGGDRTRTEIKIAPAKDGMQLAFQAHENDTYTYSWRFRIAEGMKFSGSFTHIHQIKANGGQFADAPLITFTPLEKGVMEVRHVGMRKDSDVHAVLGTMPLAGVAGQWLDVRETIRYGAADGRYQLAIRDQQGKELLHIDQGGLQMWRAGADHMRPKWGIYRKHSAALNQGRDDYVYFANFGITRGTAPSSTCGIN